MRISRPKNISVAEEEETAPNRLLKISVPVRRWIANVFIRWLCSSSSCRVGGGLQISISREFWLVKLLTIKIVSWLDVTHSGWGSCNEASTASTTGEVYFLSFLTHLIFINPFFPKRAVFPQPSCKIYLSRPSDLSAVRMTPFPISNFKESVQSDLVKDY